MRKNNQLPKSSKTAKRRATGWRDDREKAGCRHYRLKNHRSEDCRRKAACEICNFNNHTTYECRREPLWNCGPELCAVQVEDQSLFYIVELKDQKQLWRRLAP